jgi:hypothetical protein
MLLYSPTLQGMESGKCCGTRQMCVAKQTATFVRQNISIPCPTDASKVQQFSSVHDVADCGSLRDSLNLLGQKPER